jgi:DNA (cytosine-5)-methyltransferase 1
MTKLFTKDLISVRYIDLFCGIGGFRVATNQVSTELGVNAECVFSSDIDPHCQQAYYSNFGEIPHSDITKISEFDIPDHDLLMAGFPCQPFSIIGQRKGFEDTRGTLFFDIARIIEAKKPSAFVLENVKLLIGHDKGKTFSRIISVLTDLGYHVEYRVLNAINFGLPQKRERVFIVGQKNKSSFVWPTETIPMMPLKKILEKEVPQEYYASAYIRQSRLKKHQPTDNPTIWHENKAGHISAYPFSCALRAGASYNYLLVNGERRLTMREMLRLQGFPDSYKIVCNYSQTRKQAGNSLPVPVAKLVLQSVFNSQNWINDETKREITEAKNRQLILFEKGKRYETKPKIKNG